MKPTSARLVALTLYVSACTSPSPQVDGNVTAQDPSGVHRLPTGVRLDPAGVSYDLGSMPLAMVLSPDKDRIVVLLNGWREQGIQVVDRSSGRVLQTISLPAVFLGLAFSPDGRSLYVSGGDQDVIYRFDWRAGAATLADSIALAVREKGEIRHTVSGRYCPVAGRTNALCSRESCRLDCGGGSRIATGGAETRDRALSVRHRG